MKKITKISSNGLNYTFLSLPNTNIFQYEVVQKMGANLERVVEYKKPLFGISHLIEHMCFKQGMDYTTEEIKEMLKEYGVYNASTDYDRVNYYYKGTAENTETIVNLVNNIAFNDLTKVPEDEFKLERDVVYNEAKLYYDDDHQKFNFDQHAIGFGLDIRDNVLGDLETISGFELEDLIMMKALMNAKENQSINVIYDSKLVTPQELVELIEGNLIKFNLLSNQEVERLYEKSFTELATGVKEIETEAEQTLYSFTFDMPSINRLYVNKTLDFLNDYSKHSLTEEVRESRGLTYHIGSGSFRMYNRDYYHIYCDITAGNEEKLMEGIMDAIDKTLPQLNQENFDKFKKSLKTKRQLAYLNLNKYMQLVWDINENKPMFDHYEDLFTSNVDLVFDKIDEDFTLETALAILVTLRMKFQLKTGFEIWGKNPEAITK
jgi:predicted Zn-dependent peptidase